MGKPEASGIMQQLVSDASVDMALTMTAKMAGLPKETVTRIVEAGLPVMARMARENPDLFSAIYSQSLKMLPEPMPAFYGRLAETPEARAKLAEEYKTLYGPMVEAVNRAAANHAGTTEAQAEQVLTASLPAVSQAMGKATEGDGEAGMMTWLKSLGKR